MEDIGNDADTNLTSNKELNESASISTRDYVINDENIDQELEGHREIPEFKIEEITLNKKLIIDSISLYNTISTNYGQKNLDINHLAQDQLDLTLKNTELLLLNGKRISHLADLDIFVNLKELYLNQNFISEIKNLDNLLNLQVLNLNHNNISKIENIKHLKNLQILDISYNSITEFNVEEIPNENLIYIYFYYNPFFKNMNVLDYRSQIIRHIEKIERIDKLDISDRERLLLIDSDNLKYKNRLKSLIHIKNHYENYNKNKQDIFESFKKKIDADINEVLAKKENKTEKNKNVINENNNNNDNKITTTNVFYVDEEDKKMLNKIKELKKQSEEIFNNSIFQLQNRNQKYAKKSQEKQKRFMESDTVKELQKQIDILNEKFKKTNFTDPEVKKRFEEKIKDAINFKEKIIHAEDLVKKVIDDFHNKTVNKGKVKKSLDVIPEEENKNQEKNDVKNNKKEGEEGNNINEEDEGHLEDVKEVKN